MSYFKDLDEYTDEELLRELERRMRDRGKRVCDYCHREAGTPSCKFPLRHALAGV